MAYASIGTLNLRNALQLETLQVSNTRILGQLLLPRLENSLSLKQLQVLTVHAGVTKALSSLLVKVLKESRLLRKVTLAGDLSIKSSHLNET